MKTRDVVLIALSTLVGTLMYFYFLDLLCEAIKNDCQR